MDQYTSSPGRSTYCYAELTASFINFLHFYIITRQLMAFMTRTRTRRPQGQFFLQARRPSYCWSDSIRRKLKPLMTAMHRNVTDKPTLSWSFVTTSSQPCSHTTGFLGLNSHSCFHRQNNKTILITFTNTGSASTWQLLELDRADYATKSSLNTHTVRQLDHMQTIRTLLETDNDTNTSSLNFYRLDALPDG